MKRIPAFLAIAWALIALAACKDGPTATFPHKVSYDGNGNTSGSVPVDARSYLVGASVTVLGNAGNLAKAGCAFGGWNTEPDGSGTSYSEGESLAMGSADLVLYAEWPALPTYSVIYRGNGASAGSVPVDTGSYLVGASVTVLENAGNLAKTGCEFGGWNTATDGSGASYAEGDRIAVPTGGLVLYARWFPVNGLSVVLGIPAGGSLSAETSASVRQGEPLEIRATEGYASYAWYLDGAPVSGLSTATATMATGSLAAGVHEAAVVAGDSAGAFSSASLTFTVSY
jgi:hypothetical protein